ncbi:acyltransferase family protein [Chryseobacterium sp. FH1]|uniref:acyltransferase family protein n=1 Tax=Chryseobacterium sp. FH1 TaxID=1233951 RepID=UPI0004E2AB3B|nr:hypothetical protein IO90_00205 [Chryseobacterium sp. FH1]
MIKEQHFDMLQIFRGIACLLVVFHHGYANFEYFIYKLNVPFIEFISKNGKYGVDFFFVLSGFIITYTTYKYKNNKTYLKTYILNRIFKIYIPYLPISVIVLLLYKFTPLTNVDRPISVLTSLTLFPLGETALVVAWTLVFEVFFYIIFSVNFFSSKVWNVFVPFWVVAIILVNYLGTLSNNVFFNLIFNLYNLEFILGFLVAVLIKKEIKFNVYLTVFSVLLLLCAFVWMRTNQFEFFKFSSHLIIALSCSILVYLSIHVWNWKINQKNILMLIGNSSYSLYLVHTLFFGIMFRLIPVTKSKPIALLEFFTLIAVCCFISYIYYLVFEKKITSFFKSKFSQSRIIR